MEEMKQLIEQIRKKELEIREAAGSVCDKEKAIKQEAAKLHDMKICAVDSGLLVEYFHGATVIFQKTAAVMFKYKDGKLAGHEYFPKKVPVMKTEIFFGLDENETRMFSSLFRLKNELGIALSAIERWKPDMLLFDGSLVPLPGDTPRKQSNCYPLYEEVILLFQKLYLSDCLVAGVIKDAKSKRLVKILGLDGMSDSQLCLFLLKQGERTAAHKYSDEETPCLRDIGKSASFYYIRPSEDDLPLRIEVPSESDAEKTAAVLLSLCSVSREYAYPAVLVEADMVAAFSQQEALLLKEDLLSLSRGSLLQLRRNNRPFR